MEVTLREEYWIKYFTSLVTVISLYDYNSRFNRPLQLFGGNFGLITDYIYVKFVGCNVEVSHRLRVHIC
jgi:hypothetical protein